MSLYVRVYSNFYSHRKTARLRSVLGNDALWLPPRLWAYAAENQPDGNFEGYDADELAMLIGYIGDAQVMLTAMLGAGFMDSEPLRIHDWKEHNGYHDAFSIRAATAARARWSKERPPIPPERTREEKRGEEKKGDKHCLANASSIGVGEKRSSIKNSTVIPPGLDLPEFRAVWEKWLAHRKQMRKQMTIHAQDLKLLELSAMGAQRATAAVSYSLANGWQGIFEPKEANETHERTHRVSGANSGSRPRKAEPDYSKGF